MAERPTKVCHCGAEIMFVTGPNGNAIPLDVASNKHIYVLHKCSGDELKDGGPECQVRHVVGGIYINHFRTCTDPARYRRGQTQGGLFGGGRSR